MNIEISKINVHPEDIMANKIVFLSYKGNPINPFEPIWQNHENVNKGNGPPGAVAFVINEEKINEEKPARLKVTVKLCCSMPGRYFLFGYFGNNEAELNSPAFSGVFETHSLGDETKEVDVTINLKPKSFNGILHNVMWMVIPENQLQKHKQKYPENMYKENGNTIVTYLELYWLYDEIDYFTFRRSVPVEILRYLAQVCIAFSFSQEFSHDFIQWSKTTPIVNKFDRVNMSKSTDFASFSKEKIIEWVVNACFFRNPPRYDIYNGAMHFTDMELSEGKCSVVVFLNDYFNSLYDSYAICNCRDQASVLYLFLRAIGIVDVKICLIQPFGFLKLTNLVGRGLCNNPTYEEERPEKIVNPQDENRSFFANHVFCSYEGQVLDACAGPYMLDKDKYVKAAVDSVYPPNRVPPGTTNDIKEYDVITYIDYNRTMELKDPSQLDKFKEIIDYHEEKLPKEKYFVVCPWPDPRTCPVLSEDWQVLFEQTIAGDTEVIKIWKLQKKGESIHIKLYVSSSDEEEYSKNKFFSIGIKTSFHQLPYKKGPGYLGRLSAKYVVDNYSRYFWTPIQKKFMVCNVTFDVRCINVTFNLESLLVWLNELCYAHRVTNIGKYLPSRGYIKRVYDDATFPKKPEVGDKVAFLMKEHSGYLLDFKALKDDALRLIHIEDSYLEFIALKESVSKLCLVAVDKATLLAVTKKFKIKVKSK